MAKKKFTSKSIPDVFYEVIDEGWLDDETYVIVFQEMTDADGDVFHLEVEFHKDENEITYTRVYDYDTLSGTEYVSPCFQRQIDEYILRQVGELRKDAVLIEATIEVELTLDVPMNMTIIDYWNWLKNEVNVSVTAPIDSKLKLLKFKQKIKQ